MRCATPLCYTDRMVAVDPPAVETPHAPNRLRRLRTALRRRDWLGIGIELLVVTLGVLLAFQIDQWAQDRRQAREERQFLGRMWRETAAAIEETQWVMTLHARFRSEFVRAFRAIDDPAALAGLVGAPNIGCRASVVPGLGFNDTSFQELSTSGRLNIVSDDGVKSALREVVAAQADAESQRQNSYEIALESQRALDPYYVLGLDANDDRTCHMDWLRLARDPAARNALLRAVRVHTLMWNKRAFVRDRLRIAHNRIACRLGKPDCLEHVPEIFGARPRYDVIPPEARDDVRRSAEMYNGT